MVRKVGFTLGAQRAAGPTLYAVLGVEHTATARQLRDAYYKLAITGHPDHGGDPDKFKQVTAAYGVLKDVVRRAQYDAQLRLLGQSSRACSNCKGKGRVQQRRGLQALQVVCPVCKGSKVQKEGR